MVNQFLSSSSSLSGIKCSFHSLTALLVILTIVIATAVYQSQNSGQKELNDIIEDEDEDGVKVEVPSGVCDLSVGKWVYDNGSYPLYEGKQCRFMSDQLACQKFGRRDLEYQSWRWQPNECQLPRFNGTAMLERLRNKRLVYIGDSLNRNQWTSMVCLLDSTISDPSLSYKHDNGSNLITFKAIEYNATIDFYWSPLLVESNVDDPVNRLLPVRIVKVESIEKHARQWTDADILVFDSFLWWRRPQMKILWGSFEKSDGIYKDVEMLRVYEMALQTWSRWLEFHIDRNRTKLFFVSMSPTHERAEGWGGKANENCYGETEPIKIDGYKGAGSNPKMMEIVENVLEETRRRGVNVQLINITQLSEYRKEGHPSIYRRQWKVITEEQSLDPKSYSDCMHWCLPGVPDVWNELLYAYIFGF